MNKSNYYQERINLSLSYIDTHLSEDINIGQLAKISNFSPFHYQRIFRTLQCESPYEMLLRLRLEKAVFLLKHKTAMKVSEVATLSGFKSNENFSRQFKARFKVSPSTYKKSATLQNSRIYQEEIDQDFYPYIENARQSQSQKYMVVVEELESIQIAYIRGIFGQDGSILVKRYQTLIDWAIENKINYQGSLTRFGMSIDHPDVTPANKYRYDFALALPTATEPAGLIEMSEIPKGLYATIHCQGKLSDVSQAWDQLYRCWLPQSDFIPCDYPAIEEFIQGPEEIGWDNFNIKCRIPIESY